MTMIVVGVVSTYVDDRHSLPSGDFIVCLNFAYGFSLALRSGGSCFSRSDIYRLVIWDLIFWNRRLSFPDLIFLRV